MVRALIISFVLNAWPRVSWRNTGFLFVCVVERCFMSTPLGERERESRLASITSSDINER
jgi:hypothetical protein